VFGRRFSPLERVIDKTQLPGDVEAKARQNPSRLYIGPNERLDTRWFVNLKYDAFPYAVPIWCLVVTLKVQVFETEYETEYDD
jgi:hypothetical protein